MSKYDKIQVHQPDIGEDEIASVVAALRRGEISGSFGKAIPEFEEKFAAYCGCKYGVSVTSGTTALQLAVSAAEISQRALGRMKCGALVERVRHDRSEPSFGVIGGIA